MEKKFVKVPFDVEMAKRISEGEVDGRIVTRDGRNVRIICYDKKSQYYPIVALVAHRGSEITEDYNIKGEWGVDETDNRDLFLYVPQNTADLSNIEEVGKEFELNRFDRVLVRDSEVDEWNIDFFGYYKDEQYYCTGGGRFLECLPYNDRTAHLVGTTDNYDEDEEAME